ncbi:PLDc N-terminal domain-containing protein [Roseivirga sp.]|uniref:PLDc N-terminal domain-containing protein n=1 Tax=Roseivirga sp. TaxID=1964215 RepID=UPI002B26802D|nr:PLDc N-terminal domain-containing protein [Roseivirga sp.]
MNLYPPYIVPLITVLVIVILAVTIVSIMRQPIGFGNKLLWILIAVFLPLLGSAAYFVSYLLPNGIKGRSESR